MARNEMNHGMDMGVGVNLCYVSRAAVPELQRADGSALQVVRAVLREARSQRGRWKYFLMI